MKRYFYVYRITNKTINKHYYGVRSSIIEPHLDLGIKYFSSSTDKEFIKDQKINHKNYKYKVIKTFLSYDAASEYEIMLLKKFQAHKNEYFYNKAIYCNSALNCDNTGKIVVLDLSQYKYVQISTKEFHENRINYMCNWDIQNYNSVVSALDLKNNIFVSVSSEDFYRNENLKGVRFGLVLGSNNPKAKKLFVFDDDNNLRFELYGDSKEMSEKYNLPYHNLKWSARKSGEPIGIHPQTRAELRKKNKQKYIGWYGLYENSERKQFSVDFNIKLEQSLGLKKDLPKKGRPTGSRNGTALKIGIFNTEHEMVFFAHGTFNKICIENNLPHHAFANSYRNNGIPLYTNMSSNVGRLTKKGHYKYKNWYAKILTEL